MSAVSFFQILVNKALNPVWIRIRIGIQSKMLDPDEMNADPHSATLVPDPGAGSFLTLDPGWKIRPGINIPGPQVCLSVTLN